MLIGSVETSLREKSIETIKKKTPSKSISHPDSFSKLKMKPDFVAEAIFRAAYSRSREVYLPGWYWIVSIFWILYSKGIDRIAAKKYQF